MEKKTTKSLVSLADEINVRFNKMVPLLTAAERNTEAILDMTLQSCTENIDSLNQIEVVISTAHSRMMATLISLRAILEKRRSKFQADEPALEVKQQHTPPSPVEKAVKKRNAPGPKPKPRTRTTSQTRSDADLMPPPPKPGKSGISPKDLSLALESVSNEIPEIRIPRCDSRSVSEQAKRGTQSLVLVPPMPNDPYTLTNAGQAVAFNWPPITPLLPDITKPPPGIDGLDLVRSDSALDLSRRPMTPHPLNIWEQNFGSYENPLVLGQQPTVFDLRHRLNQKTANLQEMKPAGRGRGLSKMSATTSAEQPVDPVHVEALTLYFEGDRLPAYPDDYLVSRGGVPPVYSPYLQKDKTEWPLFLKARVPGEDWRGVYLDRHCSMSVIGEAAVPETARIRQTPTRLHVDVPWRGRGDPFYYFQMVTVPIAFDDGSLRLRQDFGVVRALQTSIILGHDFCVKHGVWAEYRGDGGVRLHIRDKIVEAQRAIKAYHRPDRVDRVPEEHGPY